MLAGVLAGFGGEILDDVRFESLGDPVAEVWCDLTCDDEPGVDGLTTAELDRVCGRKPADMYPDQEYVVRRCLKVVLKEEAEHHRYAVRDLAVLEAGVSEPQ